MVNEAREDGEQLGLSFLETTPRTCTSCKQPVLPGTGTVEIYEPEEMRGLFHSTPECAPGEDAYAEALGLIPPEQQPSEQVLLQGC